MKSAFISGFTAKAILFLCCLLYCSGAMAAGFRPIVLDLSYQHDKWQTRPQDQVFHFAAYTTSFDGPDDDNGDGRPDKWGIPQWVAFEIKKATIIHHLKHRPSKWMTDPLPLL